MILEPTMSSSFPEELNNKIENKIKNLSVNWHKAAASAMQIELIDFAHLLEFKSEQILGKNSYRIDLLIIKNLAKQPIPKNIARIFRTYNIFEIKGAGSSLGTDAYYKTIGYAGLFIAQTGKLNQLTTEHITLTFLCMHYPRNLIRHLTIERHLTVAKSSQGIYTVGKEIFYSQIIVMSELSLKENLYLRSLTVKAPDRSLQQQIAANCIQNTEHPAYKQYLDQFIRTTSKTKGDTNMICEAALELFGTSSKEIAQKIREEDQAYYQSQIENLSAQNQYLMNLLKENNIPFSTNSVR